MITQVKRAVGYRAAELIEEGMLVGLGTGSTAFFFIERLIERCKEGLNIRAVASSEHSRTLAAQGGISLLDINSVSALDITVDGADEVDPQKRLIKGAGGAHVREKIVASMSRELVIIIDETKLVSTLGKCKLPVEILPFAHGSTLHHMQKWGYHTELRMTSQKRPYVTDNQNFIVDIHFKTALDNPEKEHETLLHIPGVVDTGFFFNLAGRIVVGFSDGQVVIKE
jgi:ribose 5-phosphate isomerase A